MFEGSFGVPRAPQRRPRSPWTKQRTRYLRRRWAQGARGREIAAELGRGITSNAVIAKIHRLGISDLSPCGGAPGKRPPAKPIRRADKPAYWFRKGPLPVWVVVAKLYVERPARVDGGIPRRQRRSLLELREDTCRWPVGDPSSSRFFFCGAQPAHNKAYCAEHCARAYRRPRAPPREVAKPRRRRAKRGAQHVNHARRRNRRSTPSAGERG
jgi:GcrA cell cycle regulator